MSWNDTTKKNILGKRRQLCWDCKKCAGECPWSQKQNPMQVEGWDAELDIIEKGSRVTESYRIYNCPLFVKSAYKAEESEE